LNAALFEMQVRNEPAKPRLRKVIMRAIVTALYLLSAVVASQFASAPALAQSPPGALASAQFTNDPDLRCDILEVKRVSGGALNIRWRVVNTAGQGGGLAGTPGKAISYRFGWAQFYYIDPVENKKYSFLTDSAGNRILEVFEGNYAAGQQRVNWAKFPAPPAKSQKISIYIANFPPFEDIPVSE
jgi:hypothetical protein